MALAADCLCCSLILLSTQQYLAATHKCHSRVRHFGRVFDLPVQSGSMLSAMCQCALHPSNGDPSSCALTPNYPKYDRTARVRAPSVRIPTSSTSSALTEWKRCALQRSNQGLACRMPAEACSPAACSTPLHLPLSWLAWRPGRIC